MHPRTMPDRLAQIIPVTPLIIASGIVLEFLKSVLGAYGDLLYTDPYLLLAASTLWFVDIPLGLYSSWRKGIRFDLDRAGAAFAKFARYVLTVPVAVLIANAPPDGTWLDLAFGWFDEAVLGAIIYIEGRSVLRHLWGAKLRGFMRVVQKVAEWGGRQSEVLDELEDDSEKVKS